jgi:hypothetical protein
MLRQHEIEPGGVIRRTLTPRPCLGAMSLEPARSARPRWKGDSQS